MKKNPTWKKMRGWGWGSKGLNRWKWKKTHCNIMLGNTLGTKEKWKPPRPLLPKFKRNKSKAPWVQAWASQPAWNFYSRLGLPLAAWNFYSRLGLPLAAWNFYSHLSLPLAAWNFYSRLSLPLAAWNFYSQKSSSPFRTGVRNAKDRVGGINGMHYAPGSH